jgi:hypothetical protein
MCCYHLQLHFVSWRVHVFASAAIFRETTSFYIYINLL